MSHPTLGTGINRWTIAIAAFCMQLALGAVYAWSVFLKPVISLYQVSQAQANLTFSITLLALGITAGFGGYFNSRFGPRVIATVGGILYGVGVLLASFASPNIYLLYLTYGIIGGIGLGLGYIVAIAMLIKWFPDRRGFITGLAVAGFGAGAALTGPIAANLLLPTYKLNTTFIILGIAYCIIVVVAAQFFRTAPEGYAPAGWTPTSKQQEEGSARNYTLGEALRSPRWYLLWLILALNVTAGAALISVASPLAQKFTGVSAGVASTLVITISIFNGAGRLFWGWLSDALGRPYTFLAIFLVQVLAFLATPFIGAIALLFIPASLIGLCYGGGFGTMPAFAADFFGSKNSGMIYGAMLTAWSAGGIVGPLLISSIDYKTTLFILAGLMLVSCVLPLLAQVLARRQAQTVAPSTGN
ncbi:L-lactate MFS transporter [Ktedonobacter racemifer]|uniref:Major facilitator superfamily MFS_1 n=1 Tax=Ktedonobacter racemifer DSM 44963 TaxID=485913 RepID=D6TJ45_KTERA|nr:OFA family MFS transporter [Ktedonobacter racemifer]EFH89452.1 major facilitator superfamily MFS_1 [Ktedonobacter racemifer DSM 44963]